MEANNGGDQAQNPHRDPLVVGANNGASIDLTKAFFVLSVSDSAATIALPEKRVLVVVDDDA
jgi:hypothetical protein